MREDGVFFFEDIKPPIVHDRFESFLVFNNFNDCIVEAWGCGEIAGNRVGVVESHRIEQLALHVQFCPVDQCFKKQDLLHLVCHGF